ncbi:SDR family oxidoreductase [Mycetocola manganoxydans]|uniref:SDR family oxidoreductase n=1 Tax=Mycetocola manganoxydans TaxID=699879 RepID=A0A3L6ZMC1_9MICO|nr:SDR family oxidoreductase [Mycetocola manganoxydans]RLP68691.1 SDR family oxidoreductase [Mycetocola manganoxydans]GHD45326.1 NAD-dependent dehydratase [Mycetocola manganoxydans]
MSRIVIIGGHGSIARLLTQQLVARGDSVVSVFRNPDHREEIESLGAEAFVCDVETASAADLAPAMTGADGVVFAAGAGPNSGAARKRTVDFEGSVKAAAAAEQAGVKRFVQVSAIGVDDGPAPDADEVWTAYVEAKRDADDALRRTDLDWTILRPGGLTDDEPTEMITLGEHTERSSIPRADVAAVIAAVLTFPETAGHSWDLISGETPIPAAIAAAVSAG